MIRILLGISGICLTLPVLAQQGTYVPANIRAVNTLERLTYFNDGHGANEMMYGVPIPEGKVIGDTYLYKEWKRSAILLYANDKVIEGFSIRYDLAADAIDVKTDKGIKVLEGRNVKSFSWIDSTRSEPYFFINAKDLKNEGVAMAGFVEVLVDGKAPLFKKVNVSVKRADYNVALSVGSRDDKILKHPAYYMLNGNTNETLEIPNSRKKLLPMFQNRSGEMESYIDENDLSPKKEEDLTKIFTYYNSLLNTNP